MTETLTFDNLIAGHFPIVAKAETLLSGENRARGTALGKITIGAASVASSGNTGDGTLTMDVTTPILAGAKPGVYLVTCIAAASGGGTFRVQDPDGLVLGDIAVGSTFANQIKFAIADGDTDFAVGDHFHVTLAAGSGKLKLLNSANVDGSGALYGILAEAVDASGGDKPCSVYLTGEFNEDALVFGGSDTHDTHRTAARALQIFFRTIQS